MPVATPPRSPTEYKTLPFRITSLKAATSGWSVEGYASTFLGAPDAYGDVVAPGAFAASIATRTTKLLYEHSEPIGSEVELREDSVGLFGKWTIVDTQMGADAHKLAQAGVLDSLSIGYRAVESDFREDGVRVLRKVDLFEVSLVAIPANQSAIVTGVKAGGSTMSVAQRMAARGLHTVPSTLARSLGQKLVESAEYKQLAGSFDLRSEHGQVRLKVEIPGVSLLEKALTTSFATSPEQAIDRLSDIGRPALLVDLLPTIPTTENSVQVIRQTAAPTAAAVAEASATTGTTGTKQEASATWADVLVPVETISNWVPVTRQILADVASFQGLIDGELAYATRLALETQVLTGNGTRPNLQGIGGLSGINAITAGADPLAAIAEGISKARKLGKRQPDIIMVDADVWQVLSMARENAATGTLGGSLLGPPGLLGRPSLFGLPVFPSTEAAAGKAYIGATMTAPYYEHLGATIVVGTIGTQFIRNIVAVRCEIRGALGVMRPAAWSVVSGLPTS